MKKSLRLIVTEKCGRSCEGCCNKDFDLSTHTKISRLNACDNEYEEILITGGEPLLFPEKVKDLLYGIGSNKKNICLYTAASCDLEKLKSILFNYSLTGFTFTIHDNKGIVDFLKIKDLCETWNKSLRLNIFINELTSIPPMNLYKWDVKFVEWIKNCPIPENEDMRILEEPW